MQIGCSFRLKYDGLIVKGNSGFSRRILLHFTVFVTTELELHMHLQLLYVLSHAVENPNIRWVCLIYSTTCRVKGSGLGTQQPNRVNGTKLVARQGIGIWAGRFTQLVSEG